MLQSTESDMTQRLNNKKEKKEWEINVTFALGTEEFKIPE